MFTYIFTLWSACFRFHLKIILALGHEYGWYFLHKCFIVWRLTLRFHPTWKCLLHVVWSNFFFWRLFMVSLLFQHCLLKRLSFPYCFEMPSLLYIERWYVQTSLSRLFSFIGLSLCQYTLSSLLYLEKSFDI